MAPNKKNATETTTGPTPDQLMALLAANPALLAQLTGPKTDAPAVIVPKYPHPVSVKVILSDGSDRTVALTPGFNDANGNLRYHGNGKVDCGAHALQSTLTLTVCRNVKARGGFQSAESYVESCAELGWTVTPEQLTALRSAKSTKKGE